VAAVAIAAGVAAGVTVAGEDAAFSPYTMRALETYHRQVAELEIQCRKRREQIETEFRRNLDNAMKQAMRAGNLDEANAIKEMQKADARSPWDVLRKQLIGTVWQSTAGSKIGQSSV